MIYLDMDGVLTDFVSGAFNLFGGTYREEEYPLGVWDFFEGWGLTKEEFYQRIHACGPYFWTSLKEYPWAKELVSFGSYRGLVPRGEMSILTSPSRSPHCYSGKVQWLINHGINLLVTITTNKEQLAQPGRLLIDDNTENCRRFREAGGDSIIFPQPWNTYGDHPGIPTSSEKVSFVIEEVIKWRNSNPMTS